MKSFDGYLKLKLGNDYVLLAGGSHKALSDFLMSSTASNIYVKKAGDTMTGALHIYGDILTVGGNGVQYPLQITRSYNDNVNFRIGSAGTNGTNAGLNMRISNSTSGGGSETFIDLLSGGGGVSISPSLSVSGNVNANSFIKSNGTSLQFLKADGSVDSNSYALSSSLLNYLPLSGGTLTNSNFYVLSLTGGTQGKGMSLGYTDPSDSTKSYTGLILFRLSDWGMAIANYNASRAIGISFDGTPYYGWSNSKNTLLHSGNYTSYRHAYTNLTGSGTTANLAIVSSGTANGWTLKTLGSRAFDSTDYLPLAGGTMTGHIKWSDGYGNAANGWNVNSENRGIYLLNSSSSTTGAPYTYAFALHAGGVYWFDISFERGSNLMYWRAGNYDSTWGWYKFWDTSNFNPNNYVPKSGCNDITGFIGWGSGFKSGSNQWNLGNTHGLAILSAIGNNTGGPYNYSVALHVGGAYWYQLSFSRGDNQLHFRGGNSDTTWGWYTLISSVGGLTINGNLTAVNFYTTSDARKKQNIHKISDNIKQFEWKETGETSYGFVAQDLEVKHPELVNDDGNMKTVNYNAALSLVVAKLENRVKELEAKLGLETPPLYLIRAKIVRLPSFAINSDSSKTWERRAA